MHINALCYLCKNTYANVQIQHLCSRKGSQETTSFFIFPFLTQQLENSIFKKYFFFCRIIDYIMNICGIKYKDNNLNEIENKKNI